LFVTYKNNSGAGGIVDIFDLNGTFLQRLITDSSLSSPWGLAIAPSGFGPASGALLVGNKGNGMIDAYNETTGVLIGTLADTSGNPLVDANLWGLQVGNGGSANAVYFAARNNNQQDGLLGSVTYVAPEPGPFVIDIARPRSPGRAATAPLPCFATAINNSSGCARDFAIGREPRR
jgi:hypothetical protein